jgi:hypothetical protein
MRAIISAALILLATWLLASCAEDTGPGESPAQIVSASLLVNGREPMDGITPGHGDTLHLEARAALSGTAAEIRRVVVDHITPPMTEGRSVRHKGVLALYDDGTHGDPTPADQIYCHEGDLLDMMEWMGRGMQMMGGRHTFEIYAEDADGNQSNHVSLSLLVN